MKILKLLTILVYVLFLGLTSCQDEINSESGTNPNTNNASSPTASNLERSSMYDGSFDDFLDGISCSSILFPVTATVNNQQITLVSEADYQTVLNILGRYTNDNDTVTLQFPLRVRLSNYTEVEISNQAEYDALADACTTAENAGEEAINCLNIDYPITILTYSLTNEQTGSVVIESDQQLYEYMHNFSNDALFAVDYPITATLNNGTTVEISSDLDLQSQISDCLGTEAKKDEAKQDAEMLKSIMVQGLYQLKSYVNAGVNTANDYANYTINFANDLSVVAHNTVNATLQDVEGTYEVASDLEVFVSLTFSGNTTFEALNQTWQVTQYSETSISLQSTTNAAVTLVLDKI